MIPYQNKSAVVAFWTLGLLNNIPFVIMLACAKSISEGGTALVFLASNIPGLLMKLSSPYWFDKVGYNSRIVIGSVLMSLSFIFVGLFGYLKEQADQTVNSKLQQERDTMDADSISINVIMQLIGVAFCSAQGDLGEATLLALSGRADSKQAEQQQEELLTVQDEIQIDSSTGGDGADNSSYENNASSGGQKSKCITAFSSGTGAAGILGFAFVFLLTNILNISLHVTLAIATMVFPICYWIAYGYASESAQPDVKETKAEYRAVDCDDLTSSLDEDSQREANLEMASCNQRQEDSGVIVRTKLSEHDNQTPATDTFSDNPCHREDGVPKKVESECGMRDESYNSFSNSPLYSRSNVLSNQQPNLICPTNSTSDDTITTLSAYERFSLTCSLWPYMIPLFVVYAAEYALQSGVWTAIGFPVDSEEARKVFYVRSNWSYQIGVFISRSSGTIYAAPMSVLWLMPFLQVINLIFFYFVAVYQFWYNSALLLLCFYVGLLGGGVYINGYMRINKDLPVSIREFALSSASVADSSGILLADLSGLLIQSCLYKSYKIKGAVVKCPA